MNDNKQYLNSILSKFTDKDFNDKTCVCVFEKENENHQIEYRCIFIDNHNPDEGLEITLNEKRYDISSIYDWEFSIDEYIFNDLEDGYILTYLPLEQHYNIWCLLDEFYEDIEHTQGMQLYLEYCFKNGITDEIISLLGNEYVDVMHLYEEINEGYKIIYELSVENNTTVIGYNPNARMKYVTWSTTKNRKFGYELGHYYTNLKDAIHDFESRTNVLVKSSLDYMKKNILLKKENSYER